MFDRRKDFSNVPADLQQLAEDASNREKDFQTLSGTAAKDRSGILTEIVKVHQALHADIHQLHIDEGLISPPGTEIHPLNSAQDH